MKFVLITDAWEPQVNGVVTTWKNTIKILEKNNYEVIVIHPGMFFSVPLFFYPEIKIVLNPWNIFSIIKRENPDIIHIATEGPLGFFSLLYLYIYSIPFTTSLHTKFPEYINKRCKYFPLSWGYKYLKWFHSKAQKTFITTKSMKIELENWGLKNLVIWGRGVDTEKFKPMKREVRKTYIITYIGRIAIEKNILDFLEMKTNCKKVIIGDGPEKEKLQNKYKNVDWLGYKHGKELVYHYSNADVLVFPSKTDTFGLVMLESMSCGTPVIGFPVTGPIDLIEEKINGSLNDNLDIAFENAINIDRNFCREFALNKTWDKVTKILTDNFVVTK